LTDQEADKLLNENPWAKWSDARDLLLIAAEIGAAEEYDRIIGKLADAFIEAEIPDSKFESVMMSLGLNG